MVWLGKKAGIWTSHQISLAPVSEVNSGQGRERRHLLGGEGAAERMEADSQPTADTDMTNVGAEKGRGDG